MTRERKASGEPHSLGDVVDGLEELAEAGGDVTVGDALDKFGKRSFGPFLMIPALLEITPIGGIPGIPTALAIFIALIAIQMVLGRDHIWVPDFVEARSVSAKKLHQADGVLEKIAKKTDKWFRGRLRWLTSHNAARLSALLVIALAASVPPLEVLPFASSAPMLAIAAIGLALIVRDGLLMVLALLLSGTTIYLLTNALGSSAGGG